MITKVVRIQLIGFLLLAVAGVGYAGFRYAGLGNVFGSTTYPVTMQLAQSGGIFTGADVTYRGVTVGRVGPLSLTAQGVDVQLDINKSAPSIPADLDAQVANLSALGEQFVDLKPATDGGPELVAGSVIPAARTTTPVPVEDLVSSLDDFVRSVPLDALHTVVTELGTSFKNTSQPLQKILDTTNAFSADAVDALPQTLKLVHDGRTVLTTANDTAGSFQSFSKNLSLLSDQLVKSDPDLRNLIGAGPVVSDQIIGLLRESGPGLSQLVADLLTVSRVAEPRQDGLRQILVTYPALVAGASSAVPGDGTAHLGLAVNLFDPYACTQGYESTPHRPGNAVGPEALNYDAYCAEPKGSPINVRGAQNVPRAETPKPPANAPVGPPGSLPAGTAPVTSTPPLSSLAQILLG
ncbi:MlaD family protein [Pseudonocardia sp. GCM10023141]|uniref:MlaD family protein n=1 Tax=Pseudonocardia sp. GCM10023141 TaxID=3252653 RepID=UPI0036191D3F